MKKILIIQTAFLGDVILTLPLVQALAREVPDSLIDFIAIPETADVLRNHAGISNLIVYDKHGKQKSFLSFLLFRNRLRASNYDVVLCPHRSLRSCLLAKGTQAKVRIGFDNSALKSVFTEVVPWKFGMHEVDRNLSLIQPLLDFSDLSSGLSRNFRRFLFPRNIVSQPSDSFPNTVSNGRMQLLLRERSGKQSGIL